MSKTLTQAVEQAFLATGTENLKSVLMAIAAKTEENTQTLQDMLGMTKSLFASEDGKLQELSAKLLEVVSTHIDSTAAPLFKELPAADPAAQEDTAPAEETQETAPA